MATALLEQHKKKFIGYGTSACTLRPAVKCTEDDANTPSKNRQVSKLFVTKEKYNEEAKFLTEFIAKFTPFELELLEKYIIIGKNCTVPISLDTDFIESAEYEGECVHKNLYIKHTINSEYGGKSLKQLERYTDNTKFKSLLNSFRNVFEGIHFLNKLGFYNKDLKPDNLVYDDINGIIKMIDIASLQYFEHVVDIITTIDIHQNIYFACLPPEFFYVYKPHRWVLLYSSGDIPNFYPSLDGKAITDDYYKVQKPLIVKFAIILEPNEFRKLNVFSLGMVLKYVLLYITPAEKDIEYKLKMLVDILTNIEFTNVYDKGTYKYSILNRPDPEEAITLYNLFLRSINEPANFMELLIKHMPKLKMPELYQDKYVESKMFYSASAKPLLTPTSATFMPELPLFAPDLFAPDLFAPNLFAPEPQDNFLTPPTTPMYNKGGNRYKVKKNYKQTHKQTHKQPYKKNYKKTHKKTHKKTYKKTYKKK